MGREVSDMGYLVYYFRSHFKHLDEKVIKTWNDGRHLAINIEVRHWPAILSVVMDIGKRVEALYGSSFSNKCFMGIANISKMESQVPSKKSLAENHSEYHGNRVPAHTDSPREGEVMITLQLTEFIIFYLKMILMW